MDDEDIEIPEFDLELLKRKWARQPSNICTIAVDELPRRNRIVAIGGVPFPFRFTRWERFVGRIRKLFVPG